MIDKEELAQYNDAQTHYLNRLFKRLLQAEKNCKNYKTLIAEINCIVDQEIVGSALLQKQLKEIISNKK